MKKGVKRVVSFLLVILMLFSFAGCRDSGTVESVTLKYDGKKITNNELTVNLSKGSITLSADVVITNSASKDFTLSSANSSVASVEGKTVTLLKEGSAIITAAAAADSSKKHSITFYPLLSLSQNSLKLGFLWRF